ncbi:MAG: hypothetical protein ABIQ30_13775 [Devosia sp.]
MLIAGALALLIFVVAAIGALLALDVGRSDHAHWLDALKTWQQLIGSVLGFLGAAGVLVLSTAIQQDNDARRTVTSAHAIGLGLALEAERMSIGLKLGQQIATMIDFTSPTLAQTCVQFSEALQRGLAPSTPVYNAVLPQMVSFGDSNLSIFVRFYSFYNDFARGLKEVNQAACDAAAEDEIKFVLSQINGGMGYYAIIARNYDTIAPPEAGGIAVPSSAEGG